MSIFVKTKKKTTMTAILIIIVLIINAAVAHIIGNVAKDRKIGYNTAFLLSLLLSPLLGILIVIASPLVAPGDVKTNSTKTQPDEKEYKEGLSKEDLIVITIGLFMVICLFILIKYNLL
jgi:hypothetical protein